MNGKPNYGVVLGALLTIAAVALYFHFRSDPVPVGMMVEAKLAPEVKHETTVPLVIKPPLQVYKPAIKKKLKLSETIQRDESKQVIAASVTPNDDRQHRITTLVDTRTGTFESYDQVLPQPWIIPNTTTHIAVYYGLKNTEQVIRLQVQQEFLRLKAVHVEATASADLGIGKPDTFIGIGGRWSF